MFVLRFRLAAGSSSFDFAVGFAQPAGDFASDVLAQVFCREGICGGKRAHVKAMGTVMRGRELNGRSMRGSMRARRRHLVTYMLVEYIVIGILILNFDLRTDFFL